ncbi:START domain-containing protein 10 isoform X2 [Nomascus leucogenys]|uniref:START domain-containing protein 10 isoform X2 n=1 Tax=Nomascus leucogenys TaxID=61853 RepID=UPI00122D5F09|nr:START domain-containing protein 10 isoform X2 [Nomascus leucogenys]
MTTRGKKLRRIWRILEEEESVAGAVQTLLLRSVAQRRKENPREAKNSRRAPRRGPRKVASASAAASTLSEPPRRTQESRTRTRALGLPTLPMEKPAASTEPQGPRPVLGRESVQVPDDQDFRSFRSECEAEVGWNLTYSKAGVSVWVQAVEMDRTLHKIKCRMECRDVPAETLYDVLHDIEYRKKWDSNVIETFDIARLTVNADVGYYSCSLPKWVVNKSSQFLAPKAMKKMYKACLKYPEWKQKHLPHFKPWLHPEQSPLPSLALSELSVQHADSLENIDESAVAESREERMGGAGGEGSDDDTSLT